MTSPILTVHQISSSGLYLMSFSEYVTVNVSHCDQASAQLQRAM